MIGNKTFIFFTVAAVAMIMLLLRGVTIGSEAIALDAGAMAGAMMIVTIVLGMRARHAFKK